MANQTTIGELSINLKMRLEGLEKGLETAKKKLQEIEKQNEQLQNSNKSLDATFIAMSITAVAAIKEISNVVKDCVNEYNNYANANIGLKSILDGQGKSFTEAQKFIEEYISDGLVPLNNAVTAYKNLALRGYNTEQIQKTMINLKNAAAFGRQSTLEYGYAIQSATEGLKNMNPVLVDNAGVTKNMSDMYEEYASKIGKTVNSLTDEEKILAEVNGIAEETKYQIGDASRYAETYSGQQAALNAELINTKATLGEALIPTLQQFTALQQFVLSGITDFVANNKTATAGLVTFSATLLAVVVSINAVKKAYVSYKAAAAAADMTTKAFTISLMTNPITLIAVGLAGIVSGISMVNTKMQESIDKMKEAEEKSKSLVDSVNNFFSNDFSFTDGEKDIVEQRRNESQEIIRIYEERKNKIEEIQNQINAIESKSDWDTSYNEYVELDNLKVKLRDAKRELKEFEKANFTEGRGIEFHTGLLKTLNQVLELNETKQKYLNNTNAKAHRETLVNIAQTKADIKGKQQLLDILKKGKTNTDEYTNAKSQLVKLYPELAKVNENTINSTQDLINAESAAADAEWANAQVAIQASILEVQAMASNSEQIQTIANITKQSVEDVTTSLQNQLNVLGNLAKLTPEDFKGSVTSSYTPKVSSSGSSSYSNKRLDNYKKEIEHKKAMDQISLKQEIAMYQHALRNYARTADERMELREKIYDLNKELAQREKELLDQQTEDYEAYMQKQKNMRGAAYDINEQTKDYNKIIQMHKNYLNQIMKDERLSLDERKEIYREELQTIRDYEQEKRDLRVEQIDNTVSHLTNAITKQLEEMQEKEKKIIDENLKVIEEWKDARINAINEEYDARIEAINKELEALNKAEQQKTRDEEDAEYEKKKKRLEELVAFEHDATTKANYQKELDKLIAEYQKTLDARALEDKKEALNQQKELLQEEQDSKVEVIEKEAERQTEVYNKQLEELEKYYEEQIDMAQDTAEKMLLNVGKNQDKILQLLKKYGDKYEITGQTLGEKLAQGINNGLASKIENIIGKIQDKIDAGIEAQIAKMSSSVYKYEAGSGKSNVKSITTNVVQNNYIEQNPEMPSETYRKLNNVSQNLAAEIAGM